MSNATTRERGPNGRFYHVDPRPDRYDGMRVPFLPHWTAVGILADMTRERSPTLAMAGFQDVPGAPLTLRDANQMHEWGLLAKANRRNGKAMEVVFMTPRELRI